MSEGAAESSASSEAATSGGDGVASSKAFEPQLSERELRKIRYYEAMFAKMALEERQRAGANGGVGGSVSSESGGSGKKRSVSSNSNNGSGNSHASSSSSEAKHSALNANSSSASVSKTSVSSSSSAASVEAGFSASVKRKHSRLAEGGEEDCIVKASSKRSSPAGSSASGTASNSSSSTKPSSGTQLASTASVASSRRATLSSKNASSLKASLPSTLRADDGASTSSSLVQSGGGSEGSEASEEVASKFKRPQSPPASRKQQALTQSSSSSSSSSTSANGAARTSALSKSERTRNGALHAAPVGGQGSSSSSSSSECSLSREEIVVSCSTDRRIQPQRRLSPESSVPQRVPGAGASPETRKRNSSLRKDNGEAPPSAAQGSGRGFSSQQTKKAATLLESGSNAASNGEEQIQTSCVTPSRTAGSSSRGSSRQTVRGGAVCDEKPEVPSSKQQISSVATEKERRSLCAVNDNSASTSTFFKTETAEDGNSSASSRVTQSPASVGLKEEERENFLRERGERDRGGGSRVGVERRAERRNAHQQRDVHFPLQTQTGVAFSAESSGVSRRQTSAAAGTGEANFSSSSLREANPSHQTGSSEAEGGTGSACGARHSRRIATSGVGGGVGGVAHATETDATESLHSGRRSRVQSFANNGSFSSDASERKAGISLRREVGHTLRNSINSSSSSSLSALGALHSQQVQCTTSTLALSQRGVSSGEASVSSSSLPHAKTSLLPDARVAEVLPASVSSGLAGLGVSASCRNGRSAFCSMNSTAGTLPATSWNLRPVEFKGEVVGAYSGTSGSTSRSALSTSPSSPRVGGVGVAGRASSVMGECSSIKLPLHFKVKGMPPAAFAGAMASVGSAQNKDAEERARETLLFVRNLKTLAASPGSSNSHSSSLPRASPEEAQDQDENEDENEDEVISETQRSAMRQRHAPPRENLFLPNEELLPKRDWRKLLFGEEQEQNSFKGTAQSARGVEGANSLHHSDATVKSKAAEELALPPKQSAAASELNSNSNSTRGEQLRNAATDEHGSGPEANFASSCQVSKVSSSGKFDGGSQAHSGGAPSVLKCASLSLSQTKPSLQALLREVSWKGRLLRRACRDATNPMAKQNAAVERSVSGSPPN